MPKKGYIPTEEHRKKLSLARKNTESPMKGKKHSEDAKKRMSLNMKGRKPWNYIDGHTQSCGINGDGVRLEVHHKIPFLKTFDNSEKNLVTLCESCHIEAERLNKKSKGGRAI